MKKMNVAIDSSSKEILIATCLAAWLCSSTSAFDKDGNGLYDDTERKAMLGALQAACPELKGIVFDQDGDGKVTIAEQDAGRHPLSQLVPLRFVKGQVKIPWAIDLFPEWIMSGFVQEDAATGSVAKHPARGVLTLEPVQDNIALAPRKEAAGGVAFARDSGQHLVMPGHRDGRWSYRWCVFTFRIDGNSGSGNETVLLDINRGNGAGTSSPKIWYDRERGLGVQMTGYGKGGIDCRVMRSKAVVADGKTWNAVVLGMRQGRMFASVNGVPLVSETPQPSRFSCGHVYQTTSYIGDTRKANMAWAYDAIVLGQTELSEAMVRKLEGWTAHRLRFQSRLPARHPYRSRRPVLDAEDLPHRYVHDDAAWAAWGAAATDKSQTRVNAGGPRVEPQGFERVFYDDFRAFRIGLSTSGEGDLWVAPGFNTAVGIDAALIEPGREPDAYSYDAAQKLQTLSLVSQDGQRWRGSAFYSVNDLGQGYTWAGPKVFRIRCKFPETPQAELAGGLFPAFWSYGTEFLFWRTSNRIECDWFEFDGVNGHWYNGLSTHYHYPHVKNIFARQNDSYKRYKVYSGDLTEEKSKIPGGLFFWDGRFHTWEFVVDRDMTYVNVTMPADGNTERWVEVCRTKTSPTYLERLDLQLDYALKAKAGIPKGTARQDFIVDWVEVLQKTSNVEAVAAPFIARPALTGMAAAGNTLTCRANVAGVTDIRYYWFADGYPLTYGAENAYTLTPAETGKTVRCMVKAVGARDMPEAWSVGVKVR